MIIERRTNGTVRLTSTTGAVTHILSGRKYGEVVCRESEIAYYGDSQKDTYVTVPRMVFSRYEVLSALRTIPELYGALVQVYTTNTELNLWWNSSNEINLNAPECKMWIGALGISDEMVEQLRRIIDGNN